MNRTFGHLADGRDIFFFDDAPRRRVINDPRRIARPQGGNRMRYDPLLQEWVTVASSRQNRTHLPSLEECPLCPSDSHRQTEIPQTDYDVVVFENRFPSFFGDEPLTDDILHASTAAQETSGLVRPGSGRCEVVCFTSDHNSQLADAGLTRMRTVIDAWADRSEALLQRPGVEHVYCFENRGEEIGVTLHHPHGQIYGYPFITPRTKTMLDSARGYRQRRDGDLFADILAAEQRQGIRVIRRSEHWTAFVPAWARWPVEIAVYPHRQVQRLPELTGAERDDFAVVYSDLLQRCDRLFSGNLPYIAGWQQAPRSAEDGLFRLHHQLFSVRRAANKLKFLAGSESGMGAFINDIAPEDMAERLRQLAPQTGQGETHDPAQRAEA